jgi:hypothetical protein
MNMKKDVRTGGRRSAAGAAVAAAVLSLLAAFSVNAQQPNAPGQEHRPELVHRAPGALVAAGKNALPAGRLGVKTYRLEEVKLPAPVEFKRGGTKVFADSALRLTVSLDSTLNGAYTINVGDEPRPGVVTGSNTLSALFLDPADLEDGATISVSRGSGCQVEDLSPLPERLTLPARLKAARAAQKDEGNFVKSIRSIPAAAAVRGVPDVEIELATTADFPARNQVPVLQIGDQEFVREPLRQGPALVFRLTGEEFERAPDGGRVKVKYGACSSGGVRFGRLDKRALDR